ncbi:MAG TPA: diguanylate cyclase [Thermotogota bacterium]|nr:diguanylate cyclase [Thermotogota bacterium]
MSKAHKILIVDDEKPNRKILSALLEDDFEIILAKDGKQVFERLRDNKDIDLIILDIMLPDMDGYDILKHIKNNEHLKEIPVIVISVLDSLENEEKGLKLGAVDYITKPFHPGIVQLRVKNHIKLIEQRQMLEDLVGIDGLTGINNRRSFDQLYSKQWRSSRRNGNPLSLIMIDVDSFKKYNDCYGHTAGDNVLKAISGMLSSTVKRPDDTISRYGGEEFVVTLPNTDMDGGKYIAEKLRKAVEDLQIPHEKSQTSAFVTISLGGVTSHPENDLDSAEFLKTSDQMLYLAKSEGKNRVVWREQ